LLSKPEKPTDEVIISVHGMQSNCLKKREDIIGAKANEWGIAYFAFNNRGHELAGYVKKTDGDSRLEGGSSYENVYDSYYDIKAAIQKMLGLRIYQNPSTRAQFGLYKNSIYIQQNKRGR